MFRQRTVSDPKKRPDPIVFRTPLAVESCVLEF